MAAQKQSTDSSVFALISSFTSGLDVFRKLRERKQSKKRRKEELLAAAQEEARLSSSLSRGPVDIHTEYQNNYALHGERFREGDANAHASLAAVLLKLNNGLVSIISSFLGNGKKGGKLDYDRLTILSESSRLEAIDALSQLSFRLSHSRLSSLLRSSHKKSELEREREKERGKSFGNKTPKKKQSPTRSGGKQYPIRQISSSNVSSPQLALLRPRPRPKRSVSSSSNQVNSPRHSRSHSRSQSQATFPAPTSASPPRMYSPPFTPPPQKQEHQRKPSSSFKDRIVNSTPNLLSRPSRHSLPTPPDSPHAPTYHGASQPTQHHYPPSLAHSHLLSPHLPPGPTPSPAPTATPYTPRPISASFPRRRRTQKSVASMQTFSSGSTKLGEIPQHKMVQPLDYSEMARMNASAALIGGGPVGQQGAAIAMGGGKPRSGFWGGLFGRKKKQMG